MIDKLLGRLHRLVWRFGVEREPRRRRSPERIDDVLAQHAITSRAASLRAGRLPFLLRVPVSSVANSKFQNGRDCRRAPLHFSIRLSGKLPPAKRGDPAGPPLHVERENAGDAETRGDRVGKSFRSFPRPNPFSRTPLATSPAEIGVSPQARE